MHGHGHVSVLINYSGGFIHGLIMAIMNLAVICFIFLFLSTSVPLHANNIRTHKQIHTLTHTHTHTHCSLFSDSHSFTLGSVTDADRDSPRYSYIFWKSSVT